MIDSKLVQTVHRHSMIMPGDRVLVAVSGGVDSVVLLRLLWAHRAELQCELVVAHLDHQMRSNSDLDAQFVARLADELELECEIESADVPAHIESTKRSPEEAARHVRYDFLTRAAYKLDCNVMALGHHLNDRVETFFLNLLRGAGLEGLAGMPPVRRDHGLRFVRPLIECRRDEIEAAAREQNWPYREDPTNSETRYTRNRIRHELVPLLLEFNPNLLETISRTSTHIGKISELVSHYANSALSDVLVHQRDEEVALDRQALCAMDTHLAESVLREAIRALKGDLTGIEAVHTERAMDEITKQSSGNEVPLVKGLKLLVDAKRVLIVTLSEAPPEHPYCFSLDAKRADRQTFSQIGWAFDVEIFEKRVDLPEDPLEAVFDFDKIVGSLIVRNRRPGDRLRPLGMRGSKKIQDLLVDAKIPRRDRDSIPLLCDEDGILWVVGIRVSERCRVTSETSKYLKIRALKTQEE